MMKDEIKKKIIALIQDSNSTENIVEYLESLNMTSSKIEDILLEVTEYIEYKNRIEMYYILKEEANTLNLTEEELLECMIYKLKESSLKIKKRFIMTYFSVAFAILSYFNGVYSYILIKVLGILVLILTAISYAFLTKDRNKIYSLITECLDLNDCLPKIRQIISK